MPRRTPRLTQLFGLPEFSPLWIRRFLQLILLLAAWKFLSLDFTAIAPLNRDGRLLYRLPQVIEWLNGLSGSLFAEAWRIRTLQIAGAALLIAGCLLVNRATCLLGAFILLLFEWQAFQYRGVLYDLDLPIAVITIVCAAPARFGRITGRSPRRGGVATLVGRTLLLYISCMYFLAGLSKLDLDPLWWREVHLELLYATRMPLLKALPPEPFHATAQLINRVFTAMPWLAQAAAALVLFGELLWFTVLFVRPARYLMPLVMLCAHLGIFLAGGPLFFGFVCAQAALLVPWDRLPAAPWARHGVDAPTTGDRAAPPPAPAAATARAWRHVRAAGLVIAVLALAFVPLALDYHAPPFPNYRRFGWSYRRNLDRLWTTYSLGFRDPATGRLELAQQNHGGFMDFRWVTRASSTIKASLEAPNERARRRYRDDLRIFLRAARPHRSNRWLLGPFTAPAHFPLVSRPMPIDELRELELMRGVCRFEDGAVVIDWEVIGRLEVDEDLTMP